MHCTNCGQDLPEGAAVCPSCGAPVPSAPAPPVTPIWSTPPVSAPTLSRFSGVSIGSMILGILSIVLIILPFVLTYMAVVDIVAEFGNRTEITQEELMRLAENPAFQSRMIGIAVTFIGALLLALIGFILGIVGITQEKQRPTESGKVLSIVGLIMSALPMLCCVSLLFIGLITQ